MRKFGVISDTHKDKAEALPLIMRTLVEVHKIEAIIHCGDIEPRHLQPELFGDLPVFCALIEEQMERKEFETPPTGWIFTKPGHRIVQIDDCLCAYIGHKRSFEFLTGSETELAKMLDDIRTKNDWVRWLFSGHTHHQIYKQGPLINFVNPGAVESSFDGHEFCVVDVENGEIVFSRIPRTRPTGKPFSIGVISDSLNISAMDESFWPKLREEFRKREVGYVIHCGNIAVADIGRPELSDLQVFYNLRPDQKNAGSFKNWRQIPLENPVVEINGYKFYVQLDLGAALLDKSEVDMHKLCLALRRQHPEISFVLCGFTHDAFLEEGQEVTILNPGDILKDRSFAVVCLPRKEITLGHVPVDPLT